MNPKQARIAEIESITRPLLDEAAKLKQDLLEESSLFKVGDIIEWNGKRGYVTAIRRYIDTIQWKVRRIRNDGTPGAEVMVRNWEKPTKPM